MEKIVVFRQNVIDFFENLVQILFEKEYFGFKQTAHEYTTKIYNFIEAELPYFPHKNTPEKLIQFGSKYVFYNVNKHTTWYIFFENKDNRYLITYITNNHTKDVMFL